ncbi:response regulator [Rhizobiales bacterium]|uniref:PAS domain-containing hybrid sensor histidine kinase/response regulator n=1 Tax=Hongsoonwoonella zoysiae TaxID=2821844 RepID=UPI0015608A59|nr:PAS domain-containing hybrid sensor histidine kinase/response regulator [Hongsoonwoonella zoysiae]NRG16754.1 response regulator [Hongsoonwoonella zoysiae]
MEGTTERRKGREQRTDGRGSAKVGWTRFGLAPLHIRQTLAALGMAVGIAFSFWLVLGDPTGRLLAISMSFLSGTLAAWVLTGGDLARLSGRQRALDSEVHTLRREREVLEDRLWELKESDERHRSVLDSLGDVIIRRGEGGDVTYVNDAAARLFPKDVAPVAGRPLALDIDGEPDAEDGAFGDIRLETVDGPRWFSRIDLAVRDPMDARPLKQTILRDITGRRAMEEELVEARDMAEAASVAKSRFLATVSHEIRTPLNGILGMAGLLRDTRQTLEQKSYTDALVGSGESLLHLIDEVLEFSKVEAGRVELAQEPVSVSGLVEGVVELLAPKAQAKGLEIAARIGANVPREIVSDGKRLRQVLFNLAGNGLKFTETGGVAIEVCRAGQDAADGDRGIELEILVRDTGVGFTEEQAKRLFKEFEQIDHGLARRYGGTGLGLAISRRLVTLMGGTIEAEASPGAGATFRVRLPVRVERDVLEDDAAIDLPRQKIAVVSKSRISAPLIVARLQEAGAEASVVAPGSADFEEEIGDADLLMVDHAGFADAGAWLAGARAAGLEMPAAVIVKPTERDRLPRLNLAGFDAYLVEPVRTSSLFGVVTGLLDPDRRSSFWTGANALIEEENEQSAESSRPLRVLIAEDNDINRLLTEALLRKFGHEPVVATNGKAALEEVQDGSFDVLLVDLHMPEMDGVEFIARYREYENSRCWDPAPLIAVTADVMPDAHARAREAGADDVLTKPLDPDILKQALSRAS